VKGTIEGEVEKREKLISPYFEKSLSKTLEDYIIKIFLCDVETSTIKIIAYIAYT
jgi:hypothetical protein